MEKLLKDWIVEYQAGNKDILEDFLVNRTVREKNNVGEYDKVQYIQTKDKALNGIIKKIQQQYPFVDVKDMNEYINNAIWELFKEADTKKEPAEIISWSKKRMFGIVTECVREQYDINTVSENQTVSNDKEEENDVKITDVQIYREWLKGEDVNAYQKFIEFHGGIEKILSDKQKDVYSYMKSGKTQHEIAEAMKTTQQNVSKIWNSALNRIKTEYLYFRTYTILIKTNTYQIINTYLKYTDSILQFVEKDEAKLFDYTVNFLKENKDRDISFEEAQQNKIEKETTVIDALFDHVKPKDLKWFLYIYMNIDEVKESLNNKDKARFVKVVNEAFKEYKEYAKKSLEKVSERIVENGEEKYNDIIDLIS
jgi:transcriptional regulator